MPMDIPPRPAPQSRRVYAARPPRETKYDRFVKKRNFWLAAFAILAATLIVSIILIRKQDHELDKLDAAIQQESNSHKAK